ncbi:glucose-6-phosphate dehydrogenase [Taibaiella soli]|uniref:Glucose-6-phosphate 1-dehydrogenase n=1 Tax=Taibaiella soli TaxID=1649169 RepID=A0A2W2BGS6_9BACT|nr:glucose-6-phosphate dehydrogenase [Taibaiella soli]PZF72686.1 glucose-6-phosphate dehydrogenase [Taibaiella soli]
METRAKIPATVIVIFGAAGDLTWRKLMPALYNLYLGKRMPDRFMMLGVAHTDISLDDFQRHLREGIDQFSRSGKAKPDDWDDFKKHLSYQKGDFNDDATYTGLKQQIDKIEKDWGEPVNRVYYMAVPPAFFESIAVRVGKNGLCKNKQLARIVVEKPFGHDIESARHLNNLLHELFDESQIYRIDHYLGKETVQNILAFRFANAMFEPIWNRNYIDHVQITVAEQIGIENRGNYYETAGALRDMIQNHLLQLLCLVAMEPTASFKADEIRNKKVDVLNALRKITPEQVHEYAVRGQYGEGWVEGKHVKGYRQEQDVSKTSNVDTFAAVKFFIDNWRWQDVPFYLRSGKRMAETISVITIQFKQVPHRSFPVESTENWQPNKLVLNIQPHMGIQLRFQAKIPGVKMLLNPVDMVFDYVDSYPAGSPEAYETLLLDIFEGDTTLFMRSDQVEAAWNVLMPILDTWQANTSPNFPNYAAGTYGPEDAEALIAKDGHNWMVIPLETENNGRKK